jgi:hypothetical protein
LAIGIAAAVPPEGWGQVQSTDQRFVAGLRERRLFELAESYCRGRLADPALDSVARAELALQLAQVLVARAASLPLADQPAAWQGARVALDEFLTQYPEHPQREVIVVQHALTLLARGQCLRREWEISPELPQLQAEAAQQLRAAVAELDGADRLIGELLPVRQRQRTESELSIPQLMALRNNVQFQLAQCHLNSALLYQAGSAERADGLTQVSQRLDQLSGRIQPDDPLRGSIDVLRAECFRHLGQFHQAESLLAGLDPDTLDAELRGNYWGERIDLALAQKQVDRAIGWLPQFADYYANAPRLCLSMVELFLAAAGDATAPEDRALWQDRAEQVMRVLDAFHGSYWSRRASRLLLASSATKSPASSGELVLRLTEELIRKGEHEEAIRLLDMAGNQAASGNRRDAAARLAFRAAQIYQQLGEHQEAADRFRLLATAFAELPLAADAHLAACWSLAQLVPTQSGAIDEYLRLLREHLERWPNSASGDQAAIWLAPILARQAAWNEAFLVAASVRPDSSHAGRAVEIGCSAALAELATQTAEDSGQLAARAADVRRALDEWATRLAAADQPTISADRGRLVLTQIAIGLRYRGTDLPTGVTQLRALLDEYDQAAPAWKPTALAWKQLCDVGGSEAGEELESAVLEPAHSALWLHVALAQRSERNAEAMARLILNQYQLQEANLSSSDPASRIRWQMAAAESLWVLGKRDEAIDLFAKLAAQHPRVLEVQRRLALLLGGDDRDSSLEAALAAWRTVAAGSPPRSDVWFEAKLEIARLLVRLGNAPEAKQLLQYLKTVPPGWGDSSLESDFEALLKQLQSQY